MKIFLNDVRRKEKAVPVRRQILNTMGILLLGIGLGIFSKFLDTVPVNELPFLFEYLDISNFLGRFAIWVLLGLCIAVYSSSPVRAAVNTFGFFAGMVTSYYLYSEFVAGFFPAAYAMIWVGFTILSPLLAAACWYAKGKTKWSMFLAAAILSVLFQMSFVYGSGYFEAYSVLEAFVFVIGFWVMRRSTVKESAVMLAIGIVLAVICDRLVPFHFG